MLLPLGIVSAAWSADFDKKRGDAAEKSAYAAALREWEPFAMQGNVFAQRNLGVMYYNGEGVLQDNLYARMWWNIAGSPGHKNAPTNRDISAERMTPADTSTAQNLAR